jgi:N-acetylmuramoyl-L-alanine amidase
MARRLFLSAGHSNIPGKDRGAASGKYIEGVLAVEFVTLLRTELPKLGVTPIVDGYSNILAETMASFKKLVQARDIAIEIHWNAGTPAATGTEVLVPGVPSLDKASSFELALAKDTSILFSRVLGIKNRGVIPESSSARKRLGWMRIPCENNLVELCFISNFTDMISYEKNKTLLAIQYAGLLRDYLNK